MVAYSDANNSKTDKDSIEKTFDNDSDNVLQSEKDELDKVLDGAVKTLKLER